MYRVKNGLKIVLNWSCGIYVLFLCAVVRVLELMHFRKSSGDFHDYFYLLAF